MKSSSWERTWKIVPRGPSVILRIDVKICHLNGSVNSCRLRDVGHGGQRGYWHDMRLCCIEEFNGKHAMNRGNSSRFWCSALDERNDCCSLWLTLFLCMCARAIPCRPRNGIIGEVGSPTPKTTDRLLRRRIRRYSLLHDANSSDGSLVLY